MWMEGELVPGYPGLMVYGRQFGPDLHMGCGGTAQHSKAGEGVVPPYPHWPLGLSMLLSHHLFEHFHCDMPRLVGLRGFAVPSPASSAN